VLISCSPRRLIGRRFDDEHTKKDVQSWPFKVVDQGGNPVVEVDYLGEKKTFTPQEISSMVLMKVSSLSTFYYIPIDLLTQPD
jgi:L1 cell adhesion molecule like protein